MTLFALRIVADILLFGSVLFFPWWVGAILALILFFFFSNYVEMLFVAFLTDLFYGVPTERFGGFRFVLSLSAVAVFVFCTITKRYLRSPHVG